MTPAYTIYSVQKIAVKIVKKYLKKSLTLAFSRHIIGVVSEQKKYTEAKKEQKQKFEQKLHKKRPFLAGGRFYLACIRWIVGYKKARRYVGRFYWWSWRVSHPRPNGNWLLVYKHSLLRVL